MKRISLDKIRKENLDIENRFVFEIDLEDNRITKLPILQSNNKDFIVLQNKLPPSFINFIKHISNGIHFEIGNALTISPVGKSPIIFWSDVLSFTNDVINYENFPSKDFIFFGKTGVDNEMFAFYTARRFKNGEYPIVWFTPGSIDSKPFVLINSSFDKFLTINYYWLKSSDYETTFATVEDANNYSLDKNAIEKDNMSRQFFFNKLYDTFDSIIPKLNINLYSSAVSYHELILQINRLVEAT